MLDEAATGRQPFTMLQLEYAYFELAAVQNAMALACQRMDELRWTPSSRHQKYYS